MSYYDIYHPYETGRCNDKNLRKHNQTVLRVTLTVSLIFLTV